MTVAIVSRAHLAGSAFDPGAQHFKIPARIDFPQIAQVTQDFVLPQVVDALALQVKKTEQRDERGSDQDGQRSACTA